jgi:hypothetical protein
VVPESAVSASLVSPVQTVAVALGPVTLRAVQWKSSLVGSSPPNPATLTYTGWTLVVTTSTTMRERLERWA